MARERDRPGTDGGAGRTAPRAAVPATFAFVALAAAPGEVAGSVDPGLALLAGGLVAAVAYGLGRRARSRPQVAGRADAQAGRAADAGPRSAADREDADAAESLPGDEPDEVGVPAAPVAHDPDSGSAVEVLEGLGLVHPTLHLRLDPRGVVLALGGAADCVENAGQLGIACGVPLQDRLPPASRGVFVDHLDEFAAAPGEARVASLDCEFEGTEGTAVYEVHLVQRPEVGLQVFAHDVSERRREERERSRLEERLRQAFKMEALGQLAGGMAHDFNNSLTVIAGHSQLLRTQLERAGVEHADLAHIERASDEAARLTRQLLDFARTKELHPEWIDLGQLIERRRRLLDRLLRDDVQLELDLCEDPWLVRADVGSLEQVLVNLGGNAAEAMPGGGCLRIATRNLELRAEDIDPEVDPELLPGRYVAVTVTDTGAGMGPDVRARAFEPFFTTKSLGRGTGLGLASVYGIVRQSGGRIRLESAVGVGTTIEICLPASRAPLPQRDVQPRGAGLDGSETILLCEDDDGVRGVMREALASAGYHLLVAETPEEASELEAAHDDPLHLLITDVVMAGQTGSELADVLRERRPGLAVLYVSGYPIEVVERYGVPGGEGRLLSKPFTPRELLERVRRRLDRSATTVRR